ncbi:MAG: hypothetical protein IPK68_22055 [Bdellovibrionales bacterium]|nr:hypothetical protein [Bdellovibrionales bacterium]
MGAKICLRSSVYKLKIHVCGWGMWDFFGSYRPAWSMSEAEKEVYYWRQTGLEVDFKSWTH